MSEKKREVNAFGKRNPFTSIIKGNIGIIAVLIIMCVIVSIATDKFLTTNNIISVLRQISINTYIALGMTLVIILGHIDLSVGSIVAMSGTLTVGLTVNQGMPLIVAINVKLPCEYEHIFDKAVNWKYISVLGNAKDYGEKTITLNALESCSYGFLRHTEESYMLTCKIVPRETYDTFGILLKSDKEASGCLFLEFDKAMQRVSFLNLPMGVDPFWVQSCQAVPPATEPGPDGVRVCEKTMQIEDGKAIDVKIIVDHDMIEAFIDEQIAFTYRIYAKPEFETGIIAQDSNVEFYNLSISGK